MRAVLIAGSLSLVLADLAAAQPAAGPPQWNGFYVGANLGHGWSHRDFTNTLSGASPTIQQSFSNRGSDSGGGVIGGVQVGYNYRFMGNWVAGIEADFDAADISSSTSECFRGFLNSVCGTRETDVKHFGTVRGRLGYALNNVLIYGTGGWAWGHGVNTIQFTCIGPECPARSGVPPTTPGPNSVEVNPNGWAAGAGVEWAFRPNYTLGATYLHLQFDGVTENRSKSSAVFPSLFVTNRVSSNMDENLVRLGINYLF